MNAVLPILVQLVAGAAGGNVVGQLLKRFDLGPVGNSIAGAIGGFGGTWLASLIPGLDALVGGGAVSGAHLGALAGQGATGLVGGGVLTAVAGAVRSVMAKQ